MQEGIHPEYGPVVFYDRSADKYFLTKSTLVAKAVNLPTIDWEDGNTYQLQPPVLHRQECGDRRRRSGAEVQRSLRAQVIRRTFRKDRKTRRKERT